MMLRVLVGWLFLAAAATVAAAINVSSVPARTSGVAPLHVFFDATATTADSTQQPFHDLNYTWDFGDPTSGVWNTDGHSRNVAQGAVAGHVFETPGTYSVTLTVKDGAGTMAQATTMITVTNPDTVFAGANTICFSQTTDFTGAPAGAQLITTTNFSTVASALAAGKRLLLRRGQTWSLSAGLQIRNLGPGIIGAFGPGTNPVLMATANLTFVELGAPPKETYTGADWRIMDLEFNGASFPLTYGSRCSGLANQITLLRLNIHDVHVAFSFSDSFVSGMDAMFDQNAIVDCTALRMIGGSGGNGAFTSGIRFSILGTTIQDSTGGEHILRTPLLWKAVVSHNDLARQALNKVVFKLHAPPFDAAKPADWRSRSQYIMVSDNQLTDAAGGWIMMAGPQNNTGGTDPYSNQHVRDLIVERNVFNFRTNTQTGMIPDSVDTTIRNNIFSIAADARYITCVAIFQFSGTEPPPNNVRIYNNSAYSASASNFTFTSISSTAINTTIRNNLASAPNTPVNSVMISGSGTNLQASNNLLTGSPGWVVPAPSSAADFYLAPSSVAIGAGTSVPVMNDFEGNLRPVGGTWDLGAFEYVPGGGIPLLTTQPSSQSVTGGAAVTFTAAASGSPTPKYQWKKGGVDISGATSASYTIASTVAADQGSYTVVATNSAGSATSNAATLTLTIPAAFDLAGYYARNADIAAAFGNDSLGAWLHFWNYGLAEGRQYDSQFIVDEYLLLNSDLMSILGSDRQAALMHWLTYGKPLEDRIGRVPIGFNVDSYLARYPDLAAAFGSITPTALRNVTVWNHYVDWGVREGRSDGDFEAYGYLAGNSDLATVFGNDVEAAAWHWYFYGRREGRRIPSNFDVNGYRTRNPDVVVVWGNDKYGCWLHYRDTGVYEGRVFDDLFRVLEYRARYSDVQTAYGNNLTGVLNHWLFYGKPEGRLGRNP